MWLALTIVHQHLLSRLTPQPSWASKGHGDPIVSYSALVHAYCKCGFLDEAVAVYQSIRSKGAVPNLKTYNILISGYGQVRSCFRNCCLNPHTAFCSGQNILQAVRMESPDCPCLGPCSIGCFCKDLLLVASPSGCI